MLGDQPALHISRALLAELLLGMGWVLDRAQRCLRDAHWWKQKNVVVPQLALHMKLHFHVTHVPTCKVEMGASDSP